MHQPVGVLLLSYGTPARPEDVEAYYTHICRGRPPTPEQVGDLRARYDAIGGVSPLAARTQAQARGVQFELGDRFVVVAAAKHAPPFVEDGVRALAAAGVRQAVALVLAPHWSALSVGEYFERVASAADALEPPLDVTYVRDWHVEPELVELLAERVAEALGRFPAGAAVETLVTAHSLPARVLELRDPYPEQVRQTGEALAAAAGLERWRVAWQSAGRTPEPWLGPDLLDVLRSLAGQVDGVLVCPAGFTSDHLEVLYDVDVQAQELAAAVGLRLERTRSLNDDPRFCSLVARLVRDAVA